MYNLREVCTRPSSNRDTAVDREVRSGEEDSAAEAREEVVADTEVEGSVAVDSGSADSSADPGVVRKKREVEVSCESSVAEDSAAEANPTVVDFRVEEAGEAVGKAVVEVVAGTTEVAAARTELL